jgi:hypothetical protein
MSALRQFHWFPHPLATKIGSQIVLLWCFSVSAAAVIYMSQCHHYLKDDENFLVKNGKGSLLICSIFFTAANITFVVNLKLSLFIFFFYFPSYLVLFLVLVYPKQRGDTVCVCVSK